MIDIALIVAIGFLAGGVVASFVPFVPGGVLSLIGIYGYWWSTGFTNPGPMFLFLLSTIGIFAVILDYFSEILSARASGVPLITAIVAGIVGIVLLIPTGPLGSLLGIMFTIFLVEYRDSRHLKRSLRRSFVTTGAILATKVIQVMLTAAMLIGFIFVIF